MFAAGLMASDYKTGVPVEARIDPAFPYYGSDIKRQTRYILNNFATTFAAAGTSMEHVVKAHVYLKDLRDFNGFDEVWKEFFPSPPPRTTVGVPDLLVRDALGRDRSDRREAFRRPAGRQRAGYSQAARELRAGHCAWAISFSRPARSPPISRPAFRRRRASIPPSRIYGSDDQARDALHPRQPGQDLRGGGHVARPRGQGAGLPHRPRRLQRLRRSVARVSSRRRRRCTVARTTGLLIKDSLIEIDLIAAMP